jgi:hypothetical protein
MSTLFRPIISVLTLCLIFIGNAANANSPDEEEQARITIPLANTPQFTFTVPMGSTVHFFLIKTRKKEAINNYVGRITISDQGCSVGHQVSINYEKKRGEFLTAYFPKEISWNTIYKLSLNQDSKTLTIDVNGETVSVTPYHHAKFIQVIKDTNSINILNTEQH